MPHPAERAPRLSSDPAKLRGRMPSCVPGYSAAPGRGAPFGSSRSVFPLMTRATARNHAHGWARTVNPSHSRDEQRARRRRDGDQLMFPIECEDALSRTWNSRYNVGDIVEAPSMRGFFQGSLGSWAERALGPWLGTTGADPRDLIWVMPAEGGLVVFDKTAPLAGAVFACGPGLI